MNIHSVSLINERVQSCKRKKTKFLPSKVGQGYQEIKGRHWKTPQLSLIMCLCPSEERVVPLEVSRSKLSRHLEGVVFRCHKCTFTCSSEQNLQQHIQKHEELKPYQCQLCYYDSKQLHELEIHLREEHKVLVLPSIGGNVALKGTVCKFDH